MQILTQPIIIRTDTTEAMPPTDSSVGGAAIVGMGAMEAAMEITTARMVTAAETGPTTVATEVEPITATAVPATALIGVDPGMSPTPVEEITPSQGPRLAGDLTAAPFTDKPA